MAPGLTPLRTQTLVLRRIPFRESSWVLHAFTREGGRTALMARGARRSGSPLAGTVEPLDLIEAVYVPRGGKDLFTLNEASLLHGWPAVRRRLPALAAGMAMLEVLEVFLIDALPHPRLFDCAVTFLASLESGHAPALCLARFLCVLSGELGVPPRLGDCARCGETELGESPFYAASLGGVLCPRCAEGRTVRRLSPELWSALRRLFRGQRPAAYPVTLQRET